MSRILILSLSLTVSACSWTKPEDLARPGDQRIDARVERLDRNTEEARRCQAAANRRPDDDRRTGDLRDCPRNP
jgi:hypothetical protein